MAQTGEDVVMAAPASETAPTEKPKRPKKLYGKKAKEAAAAAAALAVGIELPPVEEPPTWSALTHHMSPRPVLFSPDGRFSFVASGAAIKVYDAATGYLISTLVSPPLKKQKPGKEDPAILREDSSVTCMVFNPENSMQLISGSLDGRLRFWDYSNGVMLRAVSIGYQIQDIVAHPAIASYIFVATINQPACFHKKADPDPEMSTNQSSIIRFLVRGTKPKRLLLLKEPVIQLGISSDGQFLAAASTSTIRVMRMREAVYSGWIKYTPGYPITCLAIHPSQPILATGDNGGAVKIYRAFEPEWWDNKDNIKGKKGGDKLRPPIAEYRWHAQGITDVAFTRNGAQVLSGGEEAVLVLWQLSNGSRDFVPRIGAPISSITVAPITESTISPEAALALEDGRVVMTSLTEKRLLRNMSSLRQDYTVEDVSRRRVKVHRPLTYQPGSNHLVCLSSHPSTIQLYDVTADKHVKDLEICKLNRVTRTGYSMDPQRVEHVSFTSPSPDWMATFDSWQSLDWAFCSNLKFWHQHDNDPSFYYLVTSISRPHGTTTVSAMAYRPHISNDPRLITAGADGLIKIWGYTPENRALRQRAAWKCQAEFKYRDKPALAMSWSPDGSLFAVAHNDSVSLWSGDTLSCIHVFILPLEAGQPNSVSFGGEGEECLVAGCSLQTVGWSLLDFSEQFMIDANAGTVPSLPGSSQITILDCPAKKKAKTSLITVRTGKKPSLKTVQIEDPQRPTVATYLPSRQIQSKKQELFVYGTEKGDLFAPSDALAQPEAVDLSGFQTVAGSRKPKTSLYDDIFGAGRESGGLVQKRPKAEADYRAPPKGSTAAVLSQPAHMLPSLKQLWQQAILLPPPSQPKQSTSHSGPSKAAPARADESTAMEIDEGDTTVIEDGLLNGHVLGSEEDVRLHPAPPDLIASVAKRI